MIADIHLPEPVLFNPLKHHLGYLREFVSILSDGGEDADRPAIVRELKHLGTSVMDIYTGTLGLDDLCREVSAFLSERKLRDRQAFAAWAGRRINDFRIISLSDGSQWTTKFHENCQRFVHIFPARGSMHTFRVKSNTLKSALLYCIFIGKDFITGDDLNKVRPLLGLSPIKDPLDTEAITEMIEILREDGVR